MVIRRGSAAAVIGAVAVAMAGTGVALPGVAAASTGVASIAGVVRHAGVGVGSIQVAAFVAGTPEEVASTTTDATGAWSLGSGLAPGSYDLEYMNAGNPGSWLPGWYRGATTEASATPVVVRAGATTTVDIALHRAATIGGVVRDPAGRGVGGIEVYTYVAGTSTIVGEAPTAADGSWSAPDLPSGSYQVSWFPSSSAGSWLSGWYRDAADQAHATTVAVAAPHRAEVDIRLQRAATIAGEVTHSKGAPDPGVAVYAYVAGTTTEVWESTSATDGSFALRNLAAGSYDIEYAGRWYRDAATEASATPVSVTPPRTATIHLVVPPGS